MADDVEVGKEVARRGRDLARTKEIFLREPPGEVSGPPQLYNVEVEIRKARSNRSPVVPLVVLALVVVFGAVAVALTYFINRTTRNVTVGIEEFQDINLSDILDSQKRNETALRLAQRELEDLNTALTAEVGRIQAEANQSAEIVTNDQALSDEERDLQLRQVRAQEQTAIGRARSTARPQIEAKEQEVADLRAEVDAYDSRMLQQAKRSQEALSNQQTLFDAQQERISSYYEEKITELERLRAEERRDLTRQKDELAAVLKRNHAEEVASLTRRYNPTFTEGRVVTAISRNLPALRAGIDQLPTYRQVLAAEGVWTRQRFDETRVNLEDLRVIIRRLRDIPYINSIPDALQRLEDLERTLVAEYEGLWANLATLVEQRNAEIQQHLGTIRTQEATIATRDAELEQIVYALDSHTRTSRENGYILDPRDSSRMTVYINPRIPLGQTTTGYVFREQDEPVATVEIQRTGTTLTASLVSLTSEDNPIRPFDNILVQIE
jgi:DNA repair exonuclease SbcCD ATPase subunit